MEKEKGGMRHSAVAELIKRAAGMAVIPLICYAVMEVACLAVGGRLFPDDNTWFIFFRGLTYVLLLSFGVSINLHTGRFDFSTGAVMLISGVIGARAAVATGAGPLLMLLVAVACGCVFAGISGILYITLRLPPMIIGLGMTLVLEGVTAIITGGLKPVGFGTDPSFYRFVTTPAAMIPIIIVSLIIMVVLFHYTRFGYDYRALAAGQRIAAAAGVRERVNALICYLVSGAFLGAAGALSVCSTNGVTPTISFSTIGSMFACFLPLFFSGFIMKFCNKQVAIFLGCIGYELIQIGFGQISFMRAYFTSDIYKVVEAAILVLFLIYLNNEEKIIEFVTLKKWLRRERPVENS